MQEITNLFKSQNTDEQETLSTLGTPAILASKAVPSSHKMEADKFIIIQRLYNSQSVEVSILNTEKALLYKYNLLPLSQMSIPEVNKEILTLQEWAFSENMILRNDADKIIQIRAKELKQIIASKYSRFSTEIKDGYKSLERYFEEITKFYNLPH